MSQLVKRGLNSLFAVAVSGALLFGSVQAASGFAGSDCPNDGNGFLGSCATQGECQSKCDQAHGPGMADGVCSEGCCHCLL